MTRRRLTPEEIALWHKIVETTDRLHPEVRSAAPAPLPKPKPTKHPTSRIDPADIARNPVSKTPIRPVTQSLKPSLRDQLSAAPVQMDKKAFQRMTRGKLSPEARIDLHGMYMDTAHPALIRFILNAQASGKRLVLVITGKGRTRRDDDGPIPTPRGILKHNVPQWLRMPPLAQAVLQITPAHVSHGGDGAFYVYLRRSR